MNGSAITDLNAQLEQVRRISATYGEGDTSAFKASWEKRREELEILLAEAQQERQHELIRFKLHGNQLPIGTVPLRILGKLSTDLSGMIESAAWHSRASDAESQRIEPNFVRSLDVRLAGIRSGSSELVILGNTAPDLAGDSPLADAVNNLIEMLNASNDLVVDHLADIGRSAGRYLLSMLGFLEQNNIAAEVTWLGPGGARYWDGRPAEITRLKALLDELGDPEVTTIRVDGIVRLLAATGRLEIVTIPDGEKLSIGYGSELAQYVNSLHLEQRDQFSVQRTSYPSLGAKKKPDSYRLLETSSFSSGALIISDPVRSIGIAEATDSDQPPLLPKPEGEDG